MVILMLSQAAFTRFSAREHIQAINLIAGLRGRHQREFRRPERKVRRLRPSRAEALAAHNPFARELWMREWGGQLCRRLGARAPDWDPREPVFFVTLIDERQLVYPPDVAGFRRSPPFPAIRRSYRRALHGLDHFGMLDPALYVSTQRVAGVPRFVLWHLHALVWNTTEAALARWAQRTRMTVGALLPGASGVDVQPVRPDGLRQVIWYTGKSPRQQYQLWRRDSGSLQQYDRALNGVNAVRLYALMRDLTLPDLTVTGGEGRQILRLTLAAAATWSGSIDRASSRRNRLR
ncbi:hypothetical protein MBRA_03808 [Methylobacterium brachiatum]|nr:hypothetical protein MBRA_03808 [Methylobacterium brachiatum]